MESDSRVAINMTVAPPHGFVHGPADVAKLVSAFVLFLIVLLATILPAFCVRRARRGETLEVEEEEEAENNYIPSLPVVARHQRRKMLMAISCFNCFSGGVFLATGILDVFTDATEDVATGLKAYDLKLEFPLASFSLLIGFFILLTIEQIVACHTSHAHKRRSREARPRRSPLEESSVSRWSAGGSQDGLLPRSRPRRSVSLTASLDGIHAPAPFLREAASRPLGPMHARRSTEEILEESEEAHDHLVEVMMHEGNPIRSVFLVGAISVHSLFEGLALGLETSPQQIYQLLGAISLHKTILALGIGLSLGQTREVRRCLLVACSLVFAAMSPLGLVIGMSLTYVAHANDGGHGADRFKLVSGILQGMACGTFLYVTFFEILPREINAATRPFLRTVYMVSLLAGFICMSLFVYFL